jgi:hypothetical protein
MTTRYDARPGTRFNVPGLPSGYGSPSSPSDLTVPPVGVEDVDMGLFQLFNSGIPFVVGGDGMDSKKVPVVFTAGEKWALNKRMRALRDRNNALILPLITVVRTQIVQSPDADIVGRGINQQTGEIVVQRRLDSSDRNYQQLINRLMVPHQQNLAAPAGKGDALQLTTMRATGDLASDPVVQQGGLLVPDRLNNVYETIVVPAPQFFTAQYDVTFWTQYNTHMNQLLEQLMASFLPQGNSWRLDTPKGYWFIASVDANTYTADNNFDDFSQGERIIRYKFVVKVPGYVLASRTPGAPVPIRRYVSCPTISFIAFPEAFDEPGGVDDPFLGADDPTLPLDPNDDAPSRRRDQRKTDGTRLYPNVATTNPDDPAVKRLPRGTSPARYQKVVGTDKNGKQVVQYLRVKSQNRFTGETVLSASDVDLGSVSIVVNDD